MDMTEKLLSLLRRSDWQDALRLLASFANAERAAGHIEGVKEARALMEARMLGKVEKFSDKD